MAALPQILAMLVPIAVFLWLWDRAGSPLVRRVSVVGLVLVWLYAAFEAIALSLFALSPSGIGQDNWPELWIAVLVVIGLPTWLVLRAGNRSGSAGRRGNRSG